MRVSMTSSCLQQREPLLILALGGSIQKSLAQERLAACFDRAASLRTPPSSHTTRVAHTSTSKHQEDAVRPICLFGSGGVKSQDVVPGVVCVCPCTGSDEWRGKKRRVIKFQVGLNARVIILEPFFSSELNRTKTQTALLPWVNRSA